MKWHQWSWVACFFHRPVIFVAILSSAENLRTFFCHSQQPYSRNLICSLWVRCNSKLYTTSVGSNHNFVWSFLWILLFPVGGYCSASNASHTSSSPHPAHCNCSFLIWTKNVFTKIARGSLDYWLHFYTPFILICNLFTTHTSPTSSFPTLKCIPFLPTSPSQTYFCHQTDGYYHDLQFVFLLYNQSS